MPNDGSLNHRCDPEWARDCRALINSTRVITLSTCAGDSGFNDENGSDIRVQSPWSAPVYYIFKHKSFYFFSNPASLHIRQGAGQRAAASLFADADDVTTLKGVQMSGRILACTQGQKTFAAAVSYAARYGISAGKMPVLALFKERFHAAFYRFVPDRIWYMDNRRGMGRRVQIDPEYDL